MIKGKRHQSIPHNDFRFLRLVFVVDVTVTATVLFAVVLPYYSNFKVSLRAIQKSAFIAFLVVAASALLMAIICYCVCICRPPRLLALLKKRTTANAKCELCQRIIEKFEFHSYRLDRCVIGDCWVPYFAFVVGYTIFTTVALVASLWLAIQYSSNRILLKSLLHSIPVTHVIYFMLYAMLLMLHSLGTLLYEGYQMSLLLIYLHRMLKKRKLDQQQADKNFIIQTNVVKSTSHQLIPPEICHQVKQQIDILTMPKLQILNPSTPTTLQRTPQPLTPRLPPLPAIYYRQPPSPFTSK